VLLLADDVRLVGGFAACLQDALFNTDTTWAEEEAGMLPGGWLWANTCENCSDAAGSTVTVRKN